jgi:hypothetical protein
MTGTTSTGTVQLADDLVLTRIGYGAIQLAGPMAWGPPKDRDAAKSVLRSVVELGITHIDTSDYYGPHSVNELIRETFLGLLFLAALFLQDGLGLSPLSSGLHTFPEALGVMVGSPLAARVTSPRAGPRRTTAGALAAVAVLTGSLTLINGRSSLWALSGALFLIGIAFAHVFVTAQSTAFTRISPRETGRATAIFTSLRQFGSAVGVAAVTTALVTASGQSPHQGALHGYHVAFAAAAVIALLAATTAATVHDSDATPAGEPTPHRDNHAGHEPPGFLNGDVARLRRRVR